MPLAPATYAGVTNQAVINAFFAVDSSLLTRAFPDWVAELVGPDGVRRSQMYTGPRLTDVLGADGDRVLAALKLPAHAGRGMWVKKLDGLSTTQVDVPLLDGILADVREAQLGHLVIKLGHETTRSQDLTLVRELGDRLRRELGALLWGYHFVSSRDETEMAAEKQAAHAIEWVHQAGVQGLAVWVSDRADGGWNAPWTPDAAVRQDRAARYLTTLRAGLGSHFPLALCAPAVAERHPSIPWSTLVAGVDHVMPRVYGDDLSLLDELRAAADGWTSDRARPSAPVLRAFDDGFGPDDLSALIAAADEASLTGYGFFEWQTAFEAGLWPVIVGRQPGTVFRRGSDLFLDGAPFRCIGVNLRELVHYGNSTIGLLSLTRDKHIGEQLDAARALGGRVARVFLPHVSYDPTQPAAVEEARRYLAAQGLAQPDDPSEALLTSLEARLERVLTLAAGPRDGIRPDAVRLLVALTDFNDNSGFFPVGDRPHFSHGFLHDPAWYEREWQTHYWPLVQHIVRRFRGDPRIFAWEVGNELKLPANPDLFIEFTHTVARRLKALDPFHLVGPGIISLPHCGFTEEQAARFYASPYLDFATLHLAGDDFPHLPGIADDSLEQVERRRRAYIEHDTAIAMAQGKPMLIEEAGYPSNRQANLAALLNFAISQGAIGFMPWGFSAVPDLDIRVGDITWGLDIFHPTEGGAFQQIAAHFSDVAMHGFDTRYV